MGQSPSFAPHTLALEGVTPQPWKNGGGVTRELAAWPLGSSMSDFDWRVSVADIAVDGPFSAFPGIDRQIMLLDGAGVRLQAQDGSFDHLLNQPYQPFAFAGEVALDSTLLHGPTRDLNIMTRRGKVRAAVELMHEKFELQHSMHSVLLAIAGSWEIHVGAASAANTPLQQPLSRLKPLLQKNEALLHYANEEPGQLHCTPNGEAALIRITFETLP